MLMYNNNYNNYNKDTKVDYGCKHPNSPDYIPSYATNNISNDSDSYKTLFSSRYVDGNH